MPNWFWRRSKKVDSPLKYVAATTSVAQTQDFWIQVDTSSLAQKDYLLRCLVPQFPDDFGSTDRVQSIDNAIADLIVVTQSCDLENKKAAFVALCPIVPLAKFEEFSPQLKGRWEEVRQGRREGLYLLPSPTDPSNNREARVVDFRQIISLPIGYLTEHAASLHLRWRLQSPYLEHFSQAFARFFMRVGLPSAIPPFSNKH